MPLEKRTVFLLKAFCPVVFALVGNVLADGFHIGFRNSKCAVSRLPCKCSEFRPLGFDPFGRGFFNVFDGLADGDGSGEIKKQMGVVLDGIDENGSTAEVLQHCRHVGVQRAADLVREDALAVFGAEYEVNVEAGEGLGHRVGRPFRAWFFVGNLFPGRCPGLV